MDMDGRTDGWTVERTERASCPQLRTRTDGLASFDTLSRSLFLSSLTARRYARTSQFTPLATRWHVRTVHGGGRKNAPGGLRQHTPKIYVSPDPTRTLKVAEGARGDHRRRAPAKREHKYNRNSRRTKIVSRVKPLIPHEDYVFLDSFFLILQLLFW